MLNTPHPAVALVLLVALTIVSVIPFIAWIALGEARDKKANLWFLGMFFYVLNVALFALQFALPAWLAFGVANTGSVLMMLFKTEALRLEISDTQPKWEWMALFTSTWFGIYFLLILEGYRTTWGILFMSITMIVMQARIILLLLKIKALFKSRSCLILIVGFVMAISTNLIRGASGLFPNAFIDLLAFSATSNFFFIVLLIASIFINFGYWGFVLEKVQITKNESLKDAREQELSSLAFQEYSTELQKLVKQRDQMLVDVSKFSATSSLAVFNTAIVHELSQPIQSLSLCLEGLKINIQQQNWSLASEQSDNAAQITQKMGDTLHTLRSLMQTQKTDLEVLETSEVLRQLIPILQGECTRNGIQFIYKSSDEFFIKANKILLERIIINLIANSIEAFKTQESPRADRHIKVNIKSTTGTYNPAWQLIVEDNASGFSDEILKTVTDPFVTSKITGLGVGISFASLLLRLWGGQLHAANKSTEDGGGAIVSIQIPQVCRSDS